MRITKLYIKNYKNLKDFTITFNENINLIIGQNSAGKSSLLEAITAIFKNADLNYNQSSEIEFPFDSDVYIETKKHKIPFEFAIDFETIQNNEHFNFNIAGTNIKDKSYWSLKVNEPKQERQEYFQLPNIVTYYPGLSDTMTALAETHQNQYKEKLRDGTIYNIKTLPFIHIQAHHYSLLIAALCAFAENEKVNAFFENTWHIKPQTITIKLKKPNINWANNDTANFWGASGKLRIFLEAINTTATQKTPTNSKSKHLEYTLQIEDMISLRRNLGFSESHIFHYLNMLYLSEMIESININLKNTLNNETIKHTDLSEGERQYLTIFAITKLLVHQNTLLLLDQPDNYLHPTWQNTFVENIRNLLETDPRKPQIIITSHSPNIVSNLHKEELHIMRNREGQAELRTFSINPYGQPIEKALIDFFDIESLRYAVKDDIQTLWQLIKADAYNTDEFQEKLNAFTQKVGKSDTEITKINVEIAQRRKL